LVRKKSKCNCRRNFSKKKNELANKLNPILSRAEAQFQLDNYTNNLKKRINDEDDELNKNLTLEENNKINNEINKVLDWLEKNPNATTEEFLNKKKELEQIIDPIISRAEAKIDLEKYANNAKKRMEDENDLNNYLTDKEKKNY